MRRGRTKRAGDGIRTHDNHVGNVVLYQLSYTRIRKPNIIGSRPIVVKAEQGHLILVDYKRKTRDGKPRLRTP